ncbi:hypothetical protein [Bradyrhizobium sp. 195]|uniref:hypothetical protein n=1 Tax=Bradyrhizobium sp. 195 TaxID=2782662 RepID=UPI0020014F2D|nr:hypothetical protein [Bradyrhizobium sp. 195]
MTQSPFRRLGKFDLHLLDSGGHCVQITNDPHRAAGIAGQALWQVMIKQSSSGAKLTQDG